MLALLIATILRYSENGTYDFASAYHIPTFLFLGLIVAMFLGLTNSADDIIRDRPVLQRERNIKVRLSYYVVSKTLTLGVFALVQCILFVLIGNSLLQIRGMFWIDLAIMFMTAMGGVALGLLISSLVADPKTAANIVPLVLIPQIIMGGALIKYEDMNRNLGLLYSLSHWFSEHPSTDKTHENREQTAGAVCLSIHRHALVVRRDDCRPGQTQSAHAAAGSRLMTRFNKLAAQQRNTIQKQRGRLNDLKGTSRLCSPASKANSAAEIDRYLELVDPVIARQTEIRSVALQGRERPGHSRANLCEPESVRLDRQTPRWNRSDYRRGKKPNVFFGAAETLFRNQNLACLHSTQLVLILSTLGLLVAAALDFAKSNSR